MKKKILVLVLCALLMGSAFSNITLAETKTQVEKKVETKANSDKKVNEEVDKVIKNIENVTSSTNSFSVDFKITEDGVEKNAFNIVGASSFIYDKESDLFKEASLFSTNYAEDGTSNKKDLIIKNNKIYSRKGDKFEKIGAFEVTDKEAFDTYKNLLMPLTKYPDKFKMEKDGDNIVFTFQGKDKDIYNTIKKPYDIKINDVDEASVDLKIKYTLDSKYNLNKLEFEGTTSNIKVIENVELQINLSDEIVDPELYP